MNSARESSSTEPDRVSETRNRCLKRVTNRTGGKSAQRIELGCEGSAGAHKTGMKEGTSHEDAANVNKA